MIASLADDLAKRLPWDRISEQIADASGERVLDILPAVEELPSIWVRFDPSGRISQVGFGNWHSHYESSTGFLRAQATALRDIRRLVRRKACVVEQVDATGRYRGSWLGGVRELPYAVTKETVLLRRLMFNSATTETSLPLERYSAGAYHLILREGVHDGTGA
jgi:hypothetical protein